MDSEVDCKLAELLSLKAYDHWHVQLEAGH